MLKYLEEIYLLHCYLLHGKYPGMVLNVSAIPPLKMLLHIEQYLLEKA